MPTYVTLLILKNVKECVHPPLNHVLVIPSGFEPETHSLEGCCSIQLSYGTKPLSLEEEVAIVLDVRLEV